MLVEVEVLRTTQVEIVQHILHELVLVVLGVVVMDRQIRTQHQLQQAIESMVSEVEVEVVTVQTHEEVVTVLL